MTTHIRLLLATLALGAASAAHAATAPTTSVSPLMAALDTDGDGIISAAELAAAPATLTALDVNDDGIVTLDELRAVSANGRPTRGFLGSGQAFNVLLTLDANSDGEIQSIEIANAVSSLKRLDVNGDGMLTRDELRPTLPRRVIAAN